MTFFWIGEGIRFLIFQVFEDLYDYINSLKKLVNLKADVIYPGHGPVLRNATAVLKNYIAHRTLRENQVCVFINEISNVK